MCACLLLVAGMAVVLPAAMVRQQVPQAQAWTESLLSLEQGRAGLDRLALSGAAEPLLFHRPAGCCWLGTFCFLLFGKHSCCCGADWAHVL
jgi:hypothetical protein